MTAGSAGVPSKPLFIAAGGGGDVIAASILQRKLHGRDAERFVVTYSWDRLLTDPVPGPRDPSWFEHLEPFGARNYRITADTTVRPPAYSLLPRLARELSTKFFLLDPRHGVVGLHQQLDELVRKLEVDKVYLVDSGGDILARGDEPGLRSPLADSLVLAAADDIQAPVDVLITAVGLDGELPGTYVRDVIRSIETLSAELEVRTAEQIRGSDVRWCTKLFSWHPSEVNGLLVAAARGFRGTVEIRDAALPVRVGDESATVHRCSHELLMGRNQLAKSMVASTSLTAAESALLQYRDFSELAYQRSKATLYTHRSRAETPDQHIRKLLAYCAARPADVDALSLRRAAEVMELSIAGLHAVSSLLSDRFPKRFKPPLWHVR